MRDRCDNEGHLRSFRYGRKRVQVELNQNLNPLFIGGFSEIPKTKLTCERSVPSYFILDLPTHDLAPRLAGVRSLRPNERKVGIRIQIGGVVTVGLAPRISESVRGDIRRSAIGWRFGQSLKIVGPTGVFLVVKCCRVAQALDALAGAFDVGAVFAVAATGKQQSDSDDGERVSHGDDPWGDRAFATVSGATISNNSMAGWPSQWINASRP